MADTFITALQQEKVRLERRLAAINELLTGDGSSAGFSTSGSVSTGRGNRKGTMSAAGRARVAAAQRARWAKVKAQKAAAKKR